MTKRSGNRLQAGGRPDPEGGGNPGFQDEGEQQVLGEGNEARRWCASETMADLCEGSDDPGWISDRDRIAHWLRDPWTHPERAEPE